MTLEVNELLVRIKDDRQQALHNSQHTVFTCIFLTLYNKLYSKIFSNSLHISVFS